MRDEMWQRGMLTLLSQHWSLPDQLRELRDEESTPEHQRHLASHVASTAGMAHSLLSILAAANPRLEIYAEPLEHLSEALDLAHEAAAHDDLSPEALIFALMSSLQITADGLYGTCLFLRQHAHASGVDSVKLAAAGHYFSVPASLVAGNLQVSLRYQRLLGAPGVPVSSFVCCHQGELLSRVALHLLCVSATGQPAFIGLPSPLLPLLGAEPGPWPGFEDWLESWSKAFAR